MADILQDLVFDRVWTSASDFPTYQASEDIVRADLQYHPDKLRDAHNALLAKLDIVLSQITTDIVNRYTKGESDTLLTARTQNSVEDVTFDSATGTFTITKKNGQSYQIDTTIEKLPVRCELVTEGYETFFVITNDDGSTFRTNVTSLLNTYTFADSNTLAFTTTQQEDGSYRTTAMIKDASVTLEKLALDATKYIEDNVTAAATSEANAKASETNAAAAAIRAETALQNADAAQSAAEEAEESAAASEQNAKTSETNAAASAASAADSATAATVSEQNAKTSETNAAASAESAAASAASAESRVTTAVAEVTADTQTMLDNAVAQATADADASASASAASAAASANSAAASEAKAKEYMEQAGEIVGGDFATNTDLNAHTERTDNPHAVTAEQVGLGNVPNVTTNNQTPTYTVASADAELVSGEALSTAFGKIAKAIKSLISHLADVVSHITSAERTAWNSKADGTHNHAASEITSGTLAVARGGTGVTANPSMLTNLGSTTAASVFAASPRPGVTGTLPIANGGTGQTTAPKSLYALINGASALSSTGLATGDYLGVGDVSATTGKKVTLANLVTYLNGTSGLAKIATGFYTGTGLYGSGNPVTLNVGFKPKVVFIVVGVGDAFELDNEGNSTIYTILAHNSSQLGAYGSFKADSSSGYGYYTLFISTSSTGISFYTDGYRTASDGTQNTAYVSSNAAKGQFNTSSVTYQYIALG